MPQPSSRHWLLVQHKTQEKEVGQARVHSSTGSRNSEFLRTEEGAAGTIHLFSLFLPCAALSKIPLLVKFHFIVF